MNAYLFIGGETLNGKGKTDILVRYRGGNAFIGECKFWPGPKKFDEAIDQLLSYTTWQDTKAAIILFITNKNATAVIDSAGDRLTAHSACKEAPVPADRFKRRDYRFTSPEDDQRVISLALLPVVVPKTDRSMSVSEETTVLAEDVAQVRAHVEATIGGDPEQWTKWPGGWPGDIESALVDAVFSARAVYRSKRGRGIFRNVTDWRARRTRNTYSLTALLSEIDAVGLSAWASSFGNSQMSPGRRKDAPGGPSKAATVREAAGKLRKAGINVAADIGSDTAATAKTALRSVSGIGFATPSYFLMLLGVPGIKPDRMIHRFLKDATGHSFANADAGQVLQAVATHFDVQEHELDHAIWRYESARAQDGR